MTFTSQLGYYVHMQEERKLTLLHTDAKAFQGQRIEENRLSTISPLIYICGGVFGLAGVKFIFFIVSWMAHHLSYFISLSFFFILLSCLHLNPRVLSLLPLWFPAPVLLWGCDREAVWGSAARWGEAPEQGGYTWGRVTPPAVSADAT